MINLFLKLKFIINKILPTLILSVYQFSLFNFITLTTFLYKKNGITIIQIDKIGKAQHKTNIKYY